MQALLAMDFHGPDLDDLTMFPWFTPPSSVAAIPCSELEVPYHEGLRSAELNPNTLCCTIPC
eukprot:53742-Amphidinium_carterae.1